MKGKKSEQGIQKELRVKTFPKHPAVLNYTRRQDGMNVNGVVGGSVLKPPTLNPL